METVDDNNDTENGGGDITKTLNCSKESESDNIDAIKKFIEDQEKELIDEKKTPISVVSVDNDAASSKNAEATPKDIVPNKEHDVFLDVKENVLETEKNIGDKEVLDETMAVASSVMDMILADSEAKIAKKKVKPLVKDSINTGERGLYIFGTCTV